MDNKQLCLKLARCDSETEVIRLLKTAGFWEDTTCWHYYGDNENNFATIGNQKSNPDDCTAPLNLDT